VVCISRTGNHKVKILVEGQRVKQVTQFKYLGSTISSDGCCEKDIRSRIVMRKQAFGNKKRLLIRQYELGLKEDCKMHTMERCALSSRAVIEYSNMKIVFESC